MADTSKAPVLNFTTLVSGAPIVIDRKRYEIRHPDQMAPGPIKRIETITPRADELMGLPEISDADGDELLELLREIVALMVTAPAKVVNKLGTAQLIAIVRVFTTLRAAQANTTKPRGAKSR